MWLATHASEAYFTCVKEALSHMSVFKRFKNDSRYKAIVGMGSHSHATHHYEWIRKYHPEIDLSLYTENDQIGGPAIHLTTAEGLKFTSSTLRYLYTTLYVSDYFNLKKKTNLNIIEFGVGYGGLCFTMSKYLDVKGYELIDTPEVVNLANKCLENLSIKTTIDLESASLFLSEFGLSEFEDEDIATYYNEHVLKCDYFYIMSNLHVQSRKTKFLELLKQDYTIEVVSEYPKDKWPNYGILGKKKINV